MMRVAAAIISNEEGKILICRRSAGSCSGLWALSDSKQNAGKTRSGCLTCQHGVEDHVGLWEFPGGKQEEGETLADCVLRECQEELGIVIKPGAVFGVEFYQKDGEIQEFTFLEAKILAGTPQLRVHSELQWANVEDLKKQEYCPADAEIVELLCGQ